MDMDMAATVAAATPLQGKRAVPAPTNHPQPAPQAVTPQPLPQHMVPVGVNAGELGKPWAQQFTPAQPMHAQANPLSRPNIGAPTDLHQAVAGNVGAAGTPLQRR